MQQQKELYQSKYKTLLNVAQLGGWEYDALTQELYCNKSYFSMLGRLDGTVKDWDKYSIKEVWEKWLHPDDLPKAKSYFADFILNPTIEYSQQFRMQHAEGHWVVILSRARAVRLRLAAPSSSTPITRQGWGSVMSMGNELHQCLTSHWPEHWAGGLYSAGAIRLF